MNGCSIDVGWLRPTATQQFIEGPPSRTVSEINGDFSEKSQIFPPRIFCAPAEGVPLGIGSLKVIESGTIQ